MIGNFGKDPDATLDYTIDWSAWLATGETIVISTWAIAPSGPTNTGESFSASAATIWLSGGTVGKKYRITNSITTSSVPPRVDNRSFQIAVEDR